MIFLDTSGILALAVEADCFYESAYNMMQKAQAANEKILVHNYVLVEASALLQRRIGDEESIAFLKSASLFEIVWVDSHLHSKLLNTW